MASLQTHRVLFVDDDPEAVDLYVEHFEQEADFEPVTAHSAADALGVIESANLDCVVTDSVETSDGDPLVSVAKRIRPTLPVILYSGQKPVDLPTGDADAYLEKGETAATVSPLQALEESIRELLTEETYQSAPDMAPEQDWHPLGVFDWTETSASTALLEAVGKHTTVDPTAESPLYHTLDPDALDTLLRSVVNSETEALIRFEYADLEIAVSAQGTAWYRH